jgi:hypothetical protein
MLTIDWSENIDNNAAKDTYQPIETSWRVRTTTQKTSRSEEQAASGKMLRVAAQEATVGWEEAETGQGAKMREEILEMRHEMVRSSSQSHWKDR